MKKIVKPHKACKPSSSTDVPSFTRGKDRILKSPARLLKRKKNELGEFDDDKDNFQNIRDAYNYINRNGLNNALIAVGDGNIPVDRREYLVTLPNVTVTPLKYDSTFDGSLDNTLSTLDAMTGGAIGMAPVLGDALDGLNILNDVNKGNYANAGVGLGLLALPNFIEKPYKLIKKGAKWIGDEIWLAKTLNNVGTGLKNPHIRDKWKLYRQNPGLVRDYDKYVDQWDNLDLNQMKESLPQLLLFNNNFPGLKKIRSSYYYSQDPNLFLSLATKTLNRAKYYAGGYQKLMNRLKSENSTLYNIAKESPQYAQQIYNDLINGRVGNTEDYVKSLIDLSNTFMRGMRGIDPKTNPQAYLTIAGHSMGSPTPAMDVGSPGIVLGGNYGTSVVYKPKNRLLIGSVDTWWSQRTPNFNDKSITITPASMWTGNAKQSTHLIPGGFKNNKTAVELERILNDYLYHSGNVDIPSSYGRSASHMTFWSPNKGASIADLFDIIPASEVDLNNIKFGLGYDEGKDSGIHIKKANRGKFTAAAKRAGMGAQAYARKILSAPKGKYSPTLRRRAAFAKAASKFKH